MRASFPPSASLVREAETAGRCKMSQRDLFRSPSDERAAELRARHLDRRERALWASRVDREHDAARQLAAECRAILVVLGLSGRPSG